MLLQVLPSVTLRDGLFCFLWVLHRLNPSRIEGWSENSQGCALLEQQVGRAGSPNIGVCLEQKKATKFIEAKSPKLHTKFCPP